MLKNKTSFAKTIEDMKIDKKIVDIISPVSNYKFADLNNSNNASGNNYT